MARVVCQVLHDAESLTFIWSEGQASFPPYCLQGAVYADLRRLAQQAHEELAQVGALAFPKAGFALAQTGHALFRLMFQLDQPGDAVGQEVRTWLDGLARDGAVQRLEIIGDCFSLPWSAICDRVPELAAYNQADGEGWKAFWGQRFTVLGGRRVQWLRGRNLPEKPVVAFAVDPGLRAALPPDEQNRLSEYLSSHEIAYSDSLAGLTAIFETQEVDLLYLFGRSAGGGLRLGDDIVSPKVLESAVLGRGGEDGPSGQTVVFINSTPASREQAPTKGAPNSADPQAFAHLLTAFERFANFGLIGTSQPLAAADANRCGLELLGSILYGGLTVAEALAALRKRNPLGAMLYLACCPCDIRTSTQAENTSGREPLPLPNEPYQPLAPLYEDSAAFLVGREFDTAEAAGLLDQKGVRIILVHGAPGVGKGSLLHAGVVPYLEERCVGYRFLRARAEGLPAEDERAYPILSIRASGDLAGQLAIALMDFCGRPFTYVTPAGSTHTVDLPKTLQDVAGRFASSTSPAELQAATGESWVAETLRQAFHESPNLLGRALSAIAARLPFELVLLVEHGEDLFSLSGGRSKSRRALAMLREALMESHRVKFIVSLRTEYVGRFLDELPASSDDSPQMRVFQVNPLSEEELVEVILLPTSNEPPPGAAEAPLQHFRFQIEQGLAEHIASEAVRLGRTNQEAPLALVHAVCSRLYERVKARPDPVARVADLKAVGGMDQGLANYLVQRVNAATRGRDRKALWHVLRKLSLRQPDGSSTTDLILEEDIKPDWRGDSPVEEVVSAAASDDVRVLAVNYLNVGGREGNYLSLGCDALAPVVAQQSQEADKRSHGWRKFTDALWITVPLMVLLAVFGWTLLRGANNSIDELQQENEKRGKALNVLEVSHQKLEASRWPAYLGQLRAAEQAIQVGDVIRARQALLSLKADPDDTFGLRGFDWHYLWRQMHLDHATLYGHRETVCSVSLAADGMTLATMSGDGAVRLWDTAVGRELAKLELRDKNVMVPGRCVALSGDGGFLAAGGEDGIVRVWKVQRTFPYAFAGLVSSLFPNTGGFLPLFQIPGQGLNADSIALQAELADHKGPVAALAFAPDGKTLASGGADGTVKKWDLTTPQSKAQATFKEHAGGVLALAFSPDGKLLASGGADKKVCILDVAKNAKTAILEGHPRDVEAVAWSPDGKTLATAGASADLHYPTGVIKLWNTETWKERPFPTLAVAPVFNVAFANDGKTLATCGMDNCLRLWDFASGQEQMVLRGHKGWIRSLAVARGGAVVATGSYDGTVKVWLPTQLHSRDVLKVSKEPVHNVAFSPDGSLLATGSGNGLVKVWNVATAEETLALKAHTGAVQAVAWISNGKLLASGGADGHIKVWNVDPSSATFGKEIDDVAAHPKEITCLQAGSKGQYISSGSLDGLAKVWTIENGKLGKEPILVKTESPILSLLLRDDFEFLFLATGHEDSKVRLWDGETGKPPKVSTLVGHTAAVTSMTIVFLRVEGGTLPTLITGSTDQSIKYWNLVSGKELQTSRGHGGPVTSMALGPRPELSLVTGSTDRTVKLWDPELWQQRWTFGPEPSAIRAVAVSPNGAIIAGAGQDGSVRLYRASKARVNDN